MAGDAVSESSGEGARAVPSWWIFRDVGVPMPAAERDQLWPQPPPWRDFRGGPDLPPPASRDQQAGRRLGRRPAAGMLDRRALAMVNAAIYLRRPLLVTGRPGVGKSALAYQIAHELDLGPVLSWPVTSRTTLRDGLYDYDAIGRAQAGGQRRAEPAAGRRGPVKALAGVAGPPSGAPIGDFIHLGPLGTAMLPSRLPRVLLIDELDKCDIDLPNSLLNIFEDGEFSIRELVRMRNLHPDVTVHTSDPGHTASISNGIVQCHAFPIVVITSNGEREFPAAFMRRCLRLDIAALDAERLATMVAAHFCPDGEALDPRLSELISKFIERRGQVVGGLAGDQLLNAAHLVTSGAMAAADGQDESWDELLNGIWHELSALGP